MSVDVSVRKGETVEKALRRLKKKLDREGVIREFRARRYHEKKSRKLYLQKKALKFKDWLRRKYEDA